MTNRTLGMIPGLKPPEGVPETPQGFARLPTASELHAIVKDWFVSRPNFLSASAVQEFDITPEERQELVEVYNKVIDQPEEAPEFNKDETFVFTTSPRLHDHETGFRHKATGLMFSCKWDPCLLPKEEFEELPGGAEITVLRHVWLKGWCSGDEPQYRVGRIEDVAALFDLIQGYFNDNLDVIVSDEYLKKSILNL